MKRTVFDASTSMAAPVRGLRAVRAGRSLTLKVPNPEMARPPACWMFCFNVANTKSKSSALRTQRGHGAGVLRGGLQVVLRLQPGHAAAVAELQVKAGIARIELAELDAGLDEAALAVLRDEFGVVEEAAGATR